MPLPGPSASKSSCPKFRADPTSALCLQHPPTAASWKQKEVPLVAELPSTGVGTPTLGNPLNWRTLAFGVKQTRVKY